MLNLNIIFVMYSYIYTFVASKLSYSMKTVSSDYIKESELPTPEGMSFGL